MLNELFPSLLSLRQLYYHDSTPIFRLLDITMSRETSSSHSTTMTKPKLAYLTLASSCRLIAVSGLLLLLLGTFFFNYHSTRSSVASYFPFVLQWPTYRPEPSANAPTNISHLVFGVIGSVRTWKHKRPYVESWWRPNTTRGYLFLDEAPSKEFKPWPSSSPPFRVNEDISKQELFRKIASPIQVRMFRTILEVFRQGDSNVRWYVMADDDTVLFLDNLVRVLSKYDHTKYYYIGSSSECIKSNSDLSFEMAFGGAGYALSRPLAAMLSTELDACIKRYPFLYFSDFMLFSCLNNLGVALTKERGFHQIDLRYDISGFLSSHPQTPLLSLHHLDFIDPIFPSMTPSEAINQLMKPAQVDQSRLLQQTICYHRGKSWSISVSWGYSTHIYENILDRCYLQRPIETFRPWLRSAKPPFYMFNTRVLKDNPCEVPHVFFFQSISNAPTDEIITTYARVSKRTLPPCALSGNHSADPISRIQVFSPARRQLEAGGVECCDVAADENTANVSLRPCRYGEVIA